MYKIYPKTLFVGQKVQYLPSCQSTNDEASAMIVQGAAGDTLPDEGTLVITDYQTAGRGQRGTIWEAQPGQNLMASLLLRPSFLIASEQFWLNMAVSLGIYDTLSPLLDSALRIKWPNDLYVGNKKLGGILIENSIQGYRIAWSIIGMGLNINQTEFPLTTATSLQQESPLPDSYHLPGLLRSLCESLERRYLQLQHGQRDTLKAAYLNTLFRYQEQHTFSRAGELFDGTITGIDEAGRLAITEGAAVRYYAFKEVQFVL
ncbi:biotin--[acetyl-CoA-carboxylase] ligase [Spirosoma sp. KUDC1026]|uniref:biotin--[acetyl-CoA-carboxylase] ligase n=1 Tax=Spirosoma sp. KUDC1026 TaxID=2745947 RepID=UPI00159BAC02|nr:biotin--[acetyl-CoA-carboxylase] ligase [Spirosoma sp. KUDC1026]QKZ12555.1 biotin--[acetyl-CoA-carboxylase] ligase [Spirosoma sp. KUDC1026]